MHARWFSGLIVCFAALAPLARAADEKSLPPSLVLRVRSMDTIVENVKRIVTLAGRENQAEQIEALIKTQVGPNGIQGIDVKRPFGGYGRLGENLNGVMGVVMIPIADEKAFLSLLENLNLNVTKDKSGLYTVKTPAPVPISFRFAHNYLYASALNLEALEPGNLIAPNKIFPANQKSAVSAVFRLDQLPDVAKTIATFQLEQELSKARDKKQPGETEKQRDFRMLVLNRIAEDFKTLLDDGAEITADLNINATTGEIAVDTSLTGKADSKLAKKIHELGKSTSLFAGLAGTHTAASGLLHVAAPAAVRKAVADVIEEGKAKALSSIQDESKRKQAETLVKALLPTLEAAEIDAAFALNQPQKSKQYNAIAAVKIVRGKALAKTLREMAMDLLKDAPENERSKVKLDADSAGGIKIHRLDVQDKYDAKARDVLGDNPLYFAFRDDAFFLAVGEGALESLKQALVAEPAAAPPFQATVSVARLARFLAKAGGPELTYPGMDAGLVRVTVEGGSALRLRLSSQLSVVQFFSEIAKNKTAE